MINKYKNKIIMFLIILIVSLIMCNGFIKMHYTVDTYKIADVGYIKYATNWSLKDGRILMYLLLLIMEVCNIPLMITNYIFEIGAIIISTFSVITIYDMIINVKEVDSKKTKILLVIIAYLTVFNFMYIETFYFLEAIIISTSILLFILSTKSILKETLRGLIVGTLLAIISMFVYQGTIGFFIVFSISMLIIKKQRINKEVVKYIGYIGLVTFISVFINLIVVKQIDSYLGINNTRLGLQNILYNIEYVINNMAFILINTCGLLPKYIFLGSITFLIMANILYHILQKQNREHITNVLFLFVVGVLGSFLLFVGTTTSFDCGRMYIRTWFDADVNNIVFVC